MGPQHAGAPVVGAPVRKGLAMSIDKDDQWTEAIDAAFAKVLVELAASGISHGKLR